MLKKSKQTVNRLLCKLLVMKQIKTSPVPFMPSLKPLYDFSMDREVAMLVVSKHGTQGLNIISETLKNDKEIILKAVSKDDFVNSSVVRVELRRDRNFVIDLVGKNWLMLKDMEKEFKEDEDVCRSALNCDPRAIKFVACQNLLNNREFMLTILKSNGLALEFVGNSLKDDREIVLTALNQNPNAFRFVSSEELVQDEEISKFKSMIDPIELIIKTLSGRELKAYANPNCKFSIIRNLIKTEWNLYLATIIANSRIITPEEDGSTLEELGIDSTTKIHVVFRMRGG